MKPHYLIRFNNEIRADLAMWLHFLENFNGKSVLFPEKLVSSDVTRLFTDASGLFGFAVVFGSKWFASERTESLLPPANCSERDVPHCTSSGNLGIRHGQLEILFTSDNMAVVDVIRAIQ